MREPLDAFDRFLGERGLSFKGTVVGGAALIVMGVVDRTTEDVDLLEPDIPPAVKDAARAFAKSYRGKGAPLKEEWFNNGPASLVRDLPPGWEKRRVKLYQGKHLTLLTLGRMDLLRSKLFAFCDRQQDYQDCLALKPTAAELKAIYPWLREQDGNELWPEHAARSLEAIAQARGIELEIER